MSTNDIFGKMKKTIIMLMLLIFGNQIKAQSGIDFLYDSLQFTNGVCQKTIDVTYLSVGKNPISHGNDKDDDVVFISKNAFN